MINGLPDVNPRRKAKLLDVLDIDLDWRMHLVSDGQRRRVQLLMGLLKPFQAGSPSSVLLSYRTLQRPQLSTLSLKFCSPTTGLLIAAHEGRLHSSF